MRSLIDIKELTTDEIFELVTVANDIIDNPANYTERCKGKFLTVEIIDAENDYCIGKFI